MNPTWGLDTEDGLRWKNGTVAASITWRREFPSPHPLSFGDYITIKFTSNFMMTVTHKHKEIRIFFNLPAKPLFVVIDMCVKELGVL